MKRKSGKMTTPIIIGKKAIQAAVLSIPFELAEPIMRISTIQIKESTNHNRLSMAGF